MLKRLYCALFCRKCCRRAARCHNRCAACCCKSLDSCCRADTRVRLLG